MTKKDSKDSKTSNKVTKNMTFQEILDICPDAGMVMAQYGMGCIGCMMASSETLEQGAGAHGVDADEMVKEINKLIQE